MLSESFRQVGIYLVPIHSNFSFVVLKMSLCHALCTTGRYGVFVRDM